MAAYQKTLQDLSTKILNNLKIVKEGEKEDSNERFWNYLKEQKAIPGSEVGQAFKEIDLAVKIAIGEVENENDMDVIDTLNISVDPKIDKKMYEDMICKFYSAIHHYLFMGMRAMRQQKTQSPTDSIQFSQEDLDKVVH